MSNGLRIAENTAIGYVAPVDINGAGATSDIVNLENYSHATVIVQLGAVGAACAVTLRQAKDVSGTDEKALAFSEYYTVSNTVDVPAKTSATSLTIAATDDNKKFIFEIEASQLDAANDFSCISCDIADPGAATIAGIDIICTGPRYAGATAIA